MIAIQILDSETEEFETIFKKLDKSKDGVLHVDEFKVFFESNPNFNNGGIDMDPKYLDKLCLSLDLNKSGYIDYSEFLSILVNIQIQKEEKLLRIAFQKIDKDRNGRISHDEISELFNINDTFMTDSEFSNLIE